MNKQQQIEEMAQIINGSTELDTVAYYRCMNIAKTIYNAGYQKIPEDSVVLSKGAYESLSSKAKANVVNAVEIRKETAEKFLQLAYDRCLEKSFIKKVEELAKQFGVEIKEL